MENKPKTGKKNLVTKRGDRVILRSVKVNRRENLRDLTNNVNGKLLQPVSTRTEALSSKDFNSVIKKPKKNRAEVNLLCQFSYIGNV